MRILLLAMPDTVDVMDLGIRLPNLALVSLAGNLPGHDVKVLDLVVYKPDIRRHVESIIASFRPHLVGLSAMTFQYDTLLKVAGLVRRCDPEIKIVAGGYHVTLLAEELAAGEPLPLDFIVRGEGEATMAELVAALGQPVANFGGILGLSYRDGDRWRHNQDRPLQDVARIELPRRESRLAREFHFLDMSMDVAETSRGCPFNCKFCSIHHMYGNTFRPFPLARIIEDLQAIRRQGTKAVFFVDDNITYDIDHFKAVCRAIVDHGLNDLCYLTQVTAVGIARNPDLVKEMDRANFRIIFVGFESMEPGALRDMRKPTSPEINRQAAALLRRYRMAIIAGCIIGYPEDDRESVLRQFQLIWPLKPDFLFAQILSPYPKTVVRQELLEAGLVVNPDDYQRYTGFDCNIRTHYLTRRELLDLKGRETMKANFYPSLIACNYFLRKHFSFFLRATIKGILQNLGYMILSRKPPGQHDLPLQ
jgi:anaerobic magnesium-protoporphyrin IX monomethyl ester cyclase